MNIPNEYVKAGKITREVREWAIGLVRPGIKLLEIAERIENEIVARGGKPAFPCGVGVNDITAHYSPQRHDQSYVSERDIVKVDFGVHIGGFIVDTAFTVTYNPEYQQLIEATERALNASIEKAKKDQRISEIARSIHDEAKRYGFKTITNLSGHTLDRYRVHAGKSIPNVYMSNLPVLRRNEVFAIEPFLTTAKAAGYVIDSTQETIYSLIARKRTGIVELDRFIDIVWEERRTLPFTPRWFDNIYGEKEIKKALDELVRKKIVRVYPTLVEASGSPVAQFEHTMVISDDGLLILS